VDDEAAAVEANLERAKSLVDLCFLEMGQMDSRISMQVRGWALTEEGRPYVDQGHFKLFFERIDQGFTCGFDHTFFTTGARSKDGPKSHPSDVSPLLSQDD
jgi:hypothetical protein